MDVFGIDLGTTYSACAYIPEGDQEPVAVKVDRDQFDTVPSAVFLTRSADGRPRAYVGRRAWELDADPMHKGTLVEFAKRYIGLPPGDAPTWEIDGTTFDAIDVSALILRKIRQEVARNAGADGPLRAVVTHPRDFTLPKKTATVRAIECAGIELLDTINEPEAAAYAYFDPDADRDPGIYVVFDLGGGTLDVAILDVPATGRIKVIGGSGDPVLGGKDWDEEMYELLVESAVQHHASDGFDFRHDIHPATHREIRRWARECKEKTEDRHTFTKKWLNARYRDGFQEGQQPGPSDLKALREDFEARTERLVVRCEERLDLALRESKVSDSSVRRVLPVGGSSRLRAVQAMLSRRFDGRLESLRTGRWSIDLAIAHGAARFATYLARRQAPAAGKAADLVPVASDAVMETTLAHGINVRVAGDRLEAVARKGSTLPLREEKRFRVEGGGEQIEVLLFEGSDGPLPPGAMPSARVAFGGGAQARVGDIVTVIVDVGQSGRIRVGTRHERTREEHEVDLRAGSAGRGDGEGDRRARIDEFEVL